jgi:hypothetical protein
MEPMKEMKSGTFGWGRDAFDVDVVLESVRPTSPSVGGDVGSTPVSRVLLIPEGERPSE